ncbi:hypothetical protein V8J82_14210 [Gymnodinialimonas sp. 2305UL16-5]|uniref:hypothetical protein n=1 Tax=Gymnodinialimonas mytili TaxID=3126503 RepID=UPI00309CED79
MIQTRHASPYDRVSAKNFDAYIETALEAELLPLGYERARVAGSCREKQVAAAAI